MESKVGQVLERLQTTQAVALDACLALLQHIIDTQKLDDAVMKTAKNTIAEASPSVSKESVTDLPLSRLALRANSAPSKIIFFSWPDAPYGQEALVIVGNKNVKQLIPLCKDALDGQRCA